MRRRVLPASTRATVQSTMVDFATFQRRIRSLRRVAGVYALVPPPAAHEFTRRTVRVRSNPPSPAQ